MSMKQRICNAIVAPAPVTAAHLDEIFASYFEGETPFTSSGDGDENNENGVTPLMLACDKCCSGALHYLLNQMKAPSNQDDNVEELQPIPIEHLVAVWGHPQDASSCGNSAAHHAMSAGFCEGLDLLEQIWHCIDIIEPQNTASGRYFSLLSQTNENLDTPVMMGCASGHANLIKYILERSVHLALSALPNDDKDAISENVKATWQMLREIFQMKNSEDLSSLQLACLHFNTDVVRLLIQQPQQIQICFPSLEVKFLFGDNCISSSQKEEVFNLTPLVGVSYADADSCEQTVEHLSKVIKQRNQEDNTDIFNAYKQTKCCLSLLQCELERISTETASALLLTSNEQSASSKSKGKGKQKKKQRNNTKHSQAKSGLGSDNIDNTNITGNGMSHKTWAKVKTDIGTEEVDADTPAINASPFITLHDGSVVSKSQLTEYAASVRADSPSLDDGSNEPVSGTEPKALSSILESTSTAEDVSAIMESLCLDTSMLLLSPHAMALEMSPCQLDAVQSILNHQLNATKEAKKIHSRLCQK